MAWETTGICSCVVNIFVVAWNEYCIAERIICLCCVYGRSVGFICHYTLSVPSILLKQWFYYLPDEKWNRFELGWRQYEIWLTWCPNSFTEIKSDLSYHKLFDLQRRSECKSDDICRGMKWISRVLSWMLRLSDVNGNPISFLYLALLGLHPMKHFDLVWMRINFTFVCR